MEQEFSQFSEFRESDKPLKHEEIAGFEPFYYNDKYFCVRTVNDSGSFFH